MKNFLKNHISEMVIFFVFTLFFVGELVNNRFQLNDFLVYYSAADQFVQGQDIYGISFGLASGFYKYSPVVVFFFIPFTFLSFKVAAVIYYFLTVFVIILLFRNLCQLLDKFFFSFRQKTAVIIACLALLTTANHFLRELHLGNINALLLLGVLNVILLSFNNRKIAAGILLGLCILFKPHFLILAPLFLLRKEFKLLTSFAVTGVVGLFLPAVFVGFSKNGQLLAEWVQTITSHNAPCSLYPNNISCWLQNIFSLGNISLPEKVVSLAVLAICAVLFFIFWIKNSKTEKRNTQLRNQHFLIEYFLLIACIPNLTKTDTEHFLFSLPIILFLFGLLFIRKHSIWVVFVIVLGFVAYGGNWYDLIGRQFSSFWNTWGFVGVGNWILIIATIVFSQKLKTFEKKTGSAI